MQRQHPAVGVRNESARELVGVELGVELGVAGGDVDGEPPVVRRCRKRGQAHVGEHLNHF
jgi:hypothetical protein